MVWQDFVDDFKKIMKFWERKYYFNILGNNIKLTPEEIEAVNSLYGSPEKLNKKLLEIEVSHNNLTSAERALNHALAWSEWSTQGIALPNQAFGKAQKYFQSQVKPLIKPLEDRLKQFKLEYNKLLRIIEDIIKLTNQRNTDLIKILNWQIEIGSYKLGYKSFIKDCEKLIKEAERMHSLSSN